MSRLAGICSLIEKCDVFADIGCDHGYISKYVLDNNLAGNIIAADISEKCLQKAKRLLSGNSNIKFVCTDGLKGIKADVVAIGGLGGFTIIDIIRGNLDGTVYILQPQDHTYELRLFLTQNGYCINRDNLLTENGKYYDVIRAQMGSQTLDDITARIGVFYKDNCELLKERLIKEYKKFSSYNDGGKNAEKREFLEMAIKLLHELKHF